MNSPGTMGPRAPGWPSHSGPDLWVERRHLSAKPDADAEQRQTAIVDRWNLILSSKPNVSQSNHHCRSVKFCPIFKCKCLQWRLFIFRIKCLLITTIVNRWNFVLFSNSNVFTSRKEEADGGEWSRPAFERSQHLHTQEVAHHESIFIKFKC